MEGRPAGQGLGRAANEIGRRASEQQKASWRLRSVGQDAEQLEQLRQALDLVQHDEPSQGTKLEAGFGEPSLVGWVFEVEPRDRTIARRRQLSSQSRLADLSRAQQNDDGELGQQQPKTIQVVLDCHH